MLAIYNKSTRTSVEAELSEGTTMIQIKTIDAQHKLDINIPNEPFPLFGRIVTFYNGEHWNYRLVQYAPEEISEMCFPDENYNYEDMHDSIFLGAYDDETCIGLAILQPGPFKYLYLYDLKVNREYRRQHIGRMLIEKAKSVASEQGYCGLYTQGQDNNPGACLFYLHSGFYIGGLDTNVYRHTSQAGKADILFYCELDK